MSIRKKAALLMTIILVSVLVIQYLLINSVLLATFDDLENEEVQEDIQRTSNILADELSDMEKTAKDWGHWNDTYNFMVGTNDTYVEDNLTVDTLTNLDLNVMAYINLDDVLKYAMVIDLEQGEFQAFPATLMDHIYPDSNLLAVVRENSTLTGLIEFEPQQYMLVAAVQILKNDVTGPSNGILILGRYLNEARLNTLTRSARLNFEWYAAQTMQGLKTEVNQFTSIITPQEAQIIYVNEDVNFGYIGLTDIYGEPAIILELQSPRHIYNHGRHTFLVLSSLTLIIGFVASILALYMLEKLILARLSTLSHEVSQIPDSSMAQVTAQGNDEISRLGIVINKMLRSLQQSKEALNLVNHSLEQKVVERTKQLEESIGHFEAILNSSSDALITTNDDGTITQTNPAFIKMFNYSIDPTRKLEVWDIVSPDSLAVLQQKIEYTVKDQKPRRVDVTASRQDGTTFSAEIALSVLVNGDGEVSGGVASIRDMSKQKQIEKNLRNALAKERELLELKTRFISMASHEFRTPLAIIQASADIVNHYYDQLTDAERVEHYGKIQKQIEHMTDLLDQVLTMNRNEATSIEYDPKEVNLDRLCHEIVDDVKMSTNVTHGYRYKSHGQGFPVSIDPKLIKGAISNLLSNAVKYSPVGSIVDVMLCFEPHEVLIKIADQGIGIPVEDQKYLFQPFHRAHNVGTAQGTGLGLAITKQAIELHGGGITYESQENKGTTFTITLPRIVK